MFFLSYFQHVLCHNSCIIITYVILPTSCDFCRVGIHIIAYDSKRLLISCLIIMLDVSNLFGTAIFGNHRIVHLINPPDARAIICCFYFDSSFHSTNTLESGKPLSHPVPMGDFSLFLFSSIRPQTNEPRGTGASATEAKGNRFVRCISRFHLWE